MSNEQSNQWVTRLTKDTELVCNIVLDWGQKRPICRDLVKNTPQAIREHMINKHGFKNIPELAQRECKGCKDEIVKIKLYLDKPKEWFIDNQFDYNIIKKHFVRQVTLRRNHNAE